MTDSQPNQNLLAAVVTLTDTVRHLTAELQASRLDRATRPSNESPPSPKMYNERGDLKFIPTIARNAILTEMATAIISAGGNEDDAFALIQAVDTRCPDDEGNPAPLGVTRLRAITRRASQYKG